MPDDADDEPLYEFYDTRRQLVVFVSRPILEEVLTLVQSRTRIVGLSDIRTNQVAQIELYDESIHVKVSDRPKDRDIRAAAAIGIGIVVVAVMFVLAMGFMWIWTLICSSN
jgi:hypothetical protein